MACIKILTDEDIGLKSISFNNSRHRYSSRGIIFNNNNEIAIIHKQNKNEYKLIGGGLEKNENPYTAFEREALEETGCIIKIDKCLGTIEEIKSHDNFKQTSYIFVAHIIKNTLITNYTEEEIQDGAKLMWVTLDSAMDLIYNCKNKLILSQYENKMAIYHSKFIIERDYFILNYYKNNIMNKI